MQNLQKAGGIAALIHAVAYVISIIFGVTVFFPLIEEGPGQYLAFIADHQALVYLWNLIACWVSAAALVVLALALYERLKAGAPALAQTATIFGFIWTALIIGSANLMLRDVGVIADLYGNDPRQAETTWTALEAVENGLVSGNEIVGSVWVMLLSLAALRTGGLPKILSCVGMALGAAGLLTGVLAFIPAFRFQMVFAGMIVWSGWVGIAMLCPPSRAEAQAPCVL